jgi:transcriptional regulator with XRE-family HTH domain
MNGGDNKMTVGQRIQQRRKELDMSAAELGRRIGKNRATIFRYENGDIEKLPVDVLKPIAEALLTTPEALMGWEEEKTATNNDSGMSEAKQKLFALAESCSEEEASRLLRMMELFLGK